MNSNWRLTIIISRVFSVDAHVQRQTGSATYETRYHEPVIALYWSFLYVTRVETKSDGDSG